MSKHWLGDLREWDWSEAEEVAFANYWKQKRKGGKGPEG